MAVSALREWIRRVWAAIRGRPDDADLLDELRLHLELTSEQLRRQGAAPAEAARRAGIEAGRIPQAMELMRDQRGVRWADDLARDLRHGVRTLRRQPGYLVAVVLTLGVGVGGSSAIFGAVNGILLKPLPYRDADRIVAVWQHDRRGGNDRQEASPANFLDWRERSQSFEQLAAIEPYGLDWSRPEGPTYLATWLVYEGFFDVFRTPPHLGRTFRLDEHQPGRGDVVVLGYELWQRQFGGAPDVVGRVLTLDMRPHVIVGVMPQGFSIPTDDALWTPKVLQGWERSNRTSEFYTVFGRIRPGLDVQQAAADLDAIARQLSVEHPRTNAFSSVAVVPLPDQIVGRVRSALWLLSGAVLLVLAVVTASVASMQFAQAVARAHEWAVRAALGAGRARVARQVLTETLALAVLATALGFVVARLALQTIRALAPDDVPRVTELHADAGVLGFAAAVSLLVASTSSVVPVLVAARARLRGASVPSGRTVAGGRRLARAQAGLVVFQCCATLILLVGAGLMIRSLAAVLNEPAGFRAEGVAALTIQTWNYYPDVTARVHFVRSVVDRLSSEPGILAAGMTSSVPLMETIGAEMTPFTIEGAPPLPKGESPPLVHFTIVAGDLFDALSIPLVRGRRFDIHDDATSKQVAMVNETFARQYLPNADPIGKRIRVEGVARGRGPSSHEIVGVVGDVRRNGLHESARAGIYLAHAQAPTGANAFIVRGDRSAAALLDQTRRAIWRLNPALPVYRETTMADLVGASIRERRFVQVLLTTFAALALALAAAGIYGLMSFVTTRRAREFGVRLALGASRRALFTGVLRQALVLTAIGAAIGLAGALVVTRLLAAMLYEVTPLDAPTFVAAIAVLGATAALASLLPAARAARLDPATILQSE